jgi:hypothetical protein
MKFVLWRKNWMWQYILYFILGGSLVALVAFLSGRGNPILTTLVANLPVLFILNIFLTYRAGGVDGSMIYAKGALLLLPVFVLFVGITMMLLPRLGLPLALLSSASAYAALPVAHYAGRRIGANKIPVEMPVTIVEQETLVLVNNDEYSDGNL